MSTEKFITCVYRTTSEADQSRICATGWEHLVHSNALHDVAALNAEVDRLKDEVNALRAMPSLELPELPEQAAHYLFVGDCIPLYSADQMRQYAKACTERESFERRELQFKNEILNGRIARSDFELRDAVCKERERIAKVCDAISQDSLAIFVRQALADNGNEIKASEAVGKFNASKSIRSNLELKDISAALEEKA